MQLNKLTIELTLDNNRIKAVCPELNLETHGDWRGQAIEKLQEAIDDVVIANVDSGNTPSDFVKAMYAEEDRDGFDFWLEEERCQRLKAKLLDVFCKLYPTVNRENPFAHLDIPSVDWDSGLNYDKWNKAERKAYEDFIDQGESSKLWVNFVQAICAAKYSGYDKGYRPSVYKRWKSIGLPVLSQKKMDAMTWEEIEALAFGGESAA